MHLVSQSDRGLALVLRAALREQAVVQGLPLVHFSAKRKHFCGMYWSVSLAKTAQVELISGRVEAPHYTPPLPDLHEHFVYGYVGGGGFQ